MRRCIILSGLWILTMSLLFGWGQNGHRIVGRIASGFLSQRAAAAVVEILQGRSLAEVSTWADEIRSNPRWDCAAPFHYVTVLPDSKYPDPEAPGWASGDAVRAVIFLSQRLMRSDLGPEARREALAFLVHVAGDLHQPLHVGRGCDRGGNDLTVLWFGEERRLHSVWDEAVIESADLSYTEYVEFLETPVDAPPALRSAGPRTWITEAQSLHDDVYRCNTLRDRCPCFCGECSDGESWFGGCARLDGCRLQVEGPVRLGFAYRDRARPLVNQRLVTAGLRLATLLNAIFGEQPSLPPAYRELQTELHAIPEWSDQLSACFSSGSSG